jgi:hypothetical protein
MAAVKGHGLRWFGAEGSAPRSYTPEPPVWAEAPNKPPWFISPQKSFAQCQPFGPEHAPTVICCGAMVRCAAPSSTSDERARVVRRMGACGIDARGVARAWRQIKYFATAAGRSVGFIQYEEELKSWDHGAEEDARTPASSMSDRTPI